MSQEGVPLAELVNSTCAYVLLVQLRFRYGKSPPLLNRDHNRGYYRPYQGLRVQGGASQVLLVMDLRQLEELNDGLALYLP